MALTRRERAPFLLGLGAFLAAHVAYVGAYRSRTTQGSLSDRAPRRIVAGGSVLGAGMALAAARQDRVVAVPVAAYGVALASMVAGAAAIDRDQGRPGSSPVPCCSWSPTR